MPPLPAAAVLSFLKDTKGLLTWTTHDLARALNVSIKEAEQILPVMELQGYVKPSGSSRTEWLTTPAGEVVSASKPPHFSRATVEKTLANLADRIQVFNKDVKSPFKATRAVAFGDFLSGRPQVQAADVGIELTRRRPEPNAILSASQQSLQRKLLQQLKAKTPLVNLRPHEEWMSRRSHRDLL